MGDWVKVAGLSVLAVVVQVVVALALFGVPRPPAVHTEDVGRVEWGPVFDRAGDLWSARASQSLVVPMPDGSGMLVRARRWLLDSRLHTVSGPGATADFLPRIPRNVSGVHADPGRDYVILAWDVGGNEQFRLHRWDLGDAEPVPLTEPDARAAFGAFEPSGPRIAYTSTRRNGTDFDVYLQDPMEPGSDVRILETSGMWSVAGWSPTGDRLLLAHASSNVSNELHLLDVGSKRLERVAADGDGAVRHGAPQWSRDGGSLFYASNRGSEFMHLRRLDLATAEESVLTDEIPWDVESVQQSPDGGTLVVAVNEDGRSRVYLTDPDGTELRSLDPFGDGQFAAATHPTERLLLINHVDGLGVTRGYLYDLDSGSLTRWVGPGPSARAAPEVRLVRYPTFDSIDGAPRGISAFVYPGIGEGPRPVLIDIHGGPEAQARLRTGVSAHQEDGITVITPNVRGSTGYGRTFASLDDWYRREDSVRDIGALIDWIETQPDMDGGRVGVIGGSYGGYMVLASLVHFSPRLRCGIDVVGISNFVTFLENTADYRRDLRRAEYGDERIPEMRAFLESISPLTNAERITSPLMVVQGANDPRVPVGESRQLVDRVRSNGLDVSYMEGANEGHGFRHPWNAFYAGLAQQQMTRGCLLAS